jgi:FkbM family methyltransferase
MLRSAIKRLLYGRAGIQPPRDAFADMARLLEGEEVRAICDVGANVGNVSAKFAELFSHAAIDAFEPTPSTFSRLKERNLSRVTPRNAACGEEPGRLQLNINDHSGANSFLDRPRDRKGYHTATAQHVDSVEVEVVRLDQVVAACDLLKLDIQGYELPALKGAEGLLPQVKLIYSEVQLYPIYQGATRFHETLAWLVQRNFDIYGIYTFYGDADGQWTFGDAIFISNDLRKRKLERNAEYRGVRYL